MKSRLLQTRAIEIFGKLTRVRLEPALWAALDEIFLRERGRPPTYIVSYMHLDAEACRPGIPVASALREAILNYFRAAATPQGHWDAQHGERPQGSRKGMRRFRPQLRGTVFQNDARRVAQIDQEVDELMGQDGSEHLKVKRGGKVRVRPTTGVQASQ